MEYVRISAEAIPDNPEQPPMHIDAIIDDAKKIVGKHALFGLHSSRDRYKGEHYYPFSLDKDGRVDYGVG
jgi:hypothetical protein